MLRMLQSFQGDNPLSAKELLQALHSNELWFQAVSFAREQRDARALLAILTYLTDHAYGSAPRSIQIKADVMHHDADALHRARLVAREILDMPIGTLTEGTCTTGHGQQDDVLKD